MLSIKKTVNTDNSNIYRVAQKSKPLPHYQKIVLNRVKVCQWD